MADYSDAYKPLPQDFQWHMGHDDRFAHPNCEYCKERRPDKHPTDRFRELLRTGIKDLRTIQEWMRADGYNVDEIYGARTRLESREFRYGPDDDMFSLELRPPEFWDKPTYQLHSGGRITETDFMGGDRYGHYYWTETAALNEYWNRMYKKRQAAEKDVARSKAEMDKTMERLAELNESS